MSRRGSGRGTPWSPGSAARRLTALSVVVGLLLLGGLIDRISRPAPPVAALPATADAGMPAASASNALSSTWYCSGATAAAGGQANGAVIVNNTGTRALTGVVTVVPSAGAPVSRRITVPSRSNVVTRETDLVQASYASATVSLDGGGAVVTQAVSGPLGYTTGGCTSSTSATWYFAEGSTQVGDDIYLSLFNPGATDAVADLGFATDSGPSQPTDFQGLVVPAGGMLALDLRSHVQDSKVVGTTVAARIGRLVAAELDVRTSAPPAGMTLVAGAPATSGSWYFPYGETAPSVTDDYDVYNPSSSPAKVTLLYSLSKDSAEPLRIDVAPGTVTDVAPSARLHVPAGVAYSLAVRSGTGVVVERSASSPNGPAAMLGATVISAGWSVAAGAPPGVSTTEYLVVSNPGPAEAEVTAVALSTGAASSVAPLTSLRLAPGELRSVPVPAPIEASHPAYALRSSAPVVAERDLYPVASPGASLAVGALSP